MSHIRTVLMTALVPALALTACAKKKEEATEVSIHAESDDGTTAISSADGKVRVSGPGVDIAVNNPGINLKAEDFDIDGVKLYPGSTIKTMNVNASDKSGAESANVRVGFESPSDAKTVADWFDKEMKAKGFTTTRTGYDIAGTTSDGENFSLKISDLGGSKTSGTVSVSEAK